MKQIGNIIIFCLMAASIGATYVGCSGSEETNEAEGNTETNEEPGNKKKTLSEGDKVIIKSLSVELKSPVEVNVNPEGEILSYEGDIVGKLLSDGESKLTIGDKEVTLAINGAISFYKNQNLKSGILDRGNEIVVGSYTLTLTESVVINVADQSDEFTYGGSVKGTLSADVTDTAKGIVYLGGSEITLYANKKVKKATLKTGSIVTISSIPYKLKANTVVNFAASGVFSSFAIAAAERVAVTRESETLTVNGVGGLSFTLTLSDTNPVTINLLSGGNVDSTTPYTGDIKGTLGTTDVTNANNTNIVYLGGSEITLSADKKVKKATLKKDSIVAISKTVNNIPSSTNYKLTVEAGTVVNFDTTSGAFSNFDATSVVVTRDSGELTWGEFTLTLLTDHPVKINLGSDGNVDSKTPYVENIKGALTEAKMISLGGKSRNLPVGTSVVVDKTSKKIISFEGNTAEVIAIGVDVNIDSVVVTLTETVRVTMDNMGEIVSYLGDIVGTISSTPTIDLYTYKDGAIQFHSNKKVKSGTLKTGSTVTLSHGSYKLTTTGTVVTFDTNGGFISFDAAATLPVVVTRGSGTFTVSGTGGLPLTFNDANPATINLLATGAISDIEVTLGNTEVSSTDRNYIYAENSVITLYANKNLKQATLKTNSIVAIRSTDYKLTSNTVVNFYAIAEFFPTLTQHLSSSLETVARSQ